MTHRLDLLPGAVHPQDPGGQHPFEVRNAPAAVRQQFPGLQPPTLITKDREAMPDFRQRHGDVVAEPLTTRLIGLHPPPGRRSEPDSRPPVNPRRAPRTSR